MKVAQAWFPHCPLTPETAAVHLAEWELIIEEVGCEFFEEALTSALRSSEFFPGIAVIRRHAGVSAEVRSKIEGDQAWDWVQKYIRKWWGIDRLDRGRDPETGEMRYEYAPGLPERIDYAVRAVGGLAAITRVRLDSEPFMRKEFVEAFDRARFSERWPLQLPVLSGQSQSSMPLKAVPKAALASDGDAPAPITRKIQRPRTDEELDARRLELKQQAEQLLKEKK